MKRLNKSLVLIAAAACIGTAFAQSNASDAAMEGYVRDPSGAGVSSAKVSARNLETNISLDTATAADGYYRFPLLHVGTYELKVSAPGFRDYTQSGLTLAIGAKAHVDVALQVGSASQTVTVHADASQADTGSAGAGNVLEQGALKALPVASRNIYDLFLLSPGIQGLPTDHIRTTYLSFNGGERANWTVDGLDDTEHTVNRQIRLVVVMPDAVQEMQVMGNGYSAEFGGAAGGQVNLVLKSGTNALHGSALYQQRPDALQAAPALLNGPQPNRSWWDAGFTLGGPIIKNRLFFFGESEFNPYTLPRAITVTPANAAALNLPTSDLGPSPYGETYHAYLGKVDYRLNDHNFGFFRVNRFTNHQPNNASGLTVPSRGMTYFDSENAGAFQLASILSPAMLNEVRGGVIERDSGNGLLGDVSPDAAYINITGVANIGRNPLAATDTRERTVQVTDNLTITKGRHTFKAGVDYENTGVDVLKSQNRTFVFGGLAASNGRPAVSALNQYLDTLAGQIDTATGKPFTYTQLQVDRGNPRLSTSFNFFKGFAQDEFRIGPQFSINAGLRYELILFPELDPNAPYPLSRHVNNDTHDFAPRITFNWAPFKSRKTVISGAYGLYYDVPNLSIFYGAAQVNGERVLSYKVPGTSPLAPVFPNVPAIDDPNFLVKPSISAFAPDFRNQYQEQAVLQIRHEAPFGLLISAGYNFAAMRHSLYSVNINTGPISGYLADGRPMFGSSSKAPDQSFNQINLFESGGTGSYNAGFLNITRRFSSGFSFGIAYTYSHALSTTLGEGGAPEDPTNLQRDYGNSDMDVRHNLVLNGAYEPHSVTKALRWINGFQFSSIAYYNSGLPVNVLTGTDLNGDGNLNDRPLFVSRNSVTGPDFLQVDARIQRSLTFRERYRASFTAEFENLLNSVNPNCATNTGCSSAVINTAGAADFGRLTSAATARNVQLGVRFEF